MPKVSHHHGTKNVRITLGGRRVFYSSSNGEQNMITARRIDVVDTTAAGGYFWSECVGNCEREL